LRAQRSTTAWSGWRTRLAHALGGLYDLPHGLCCALALPVAMHFNLESRRERFEEIAQVIGYAHVQSEVVPMPGAVVQGSVWDKTFTAEDAVSCACAN
jgi:alcohol dehydrogenase class IV